ncbi:MAG: hypothetical protein ACYC3Q_15470 [Gemmatimonadaceae bacterium]
MAGEIALAVDGMTAAAEAEAASYYSDFSMDIPDTCRLKLYIAVSSTVGTIASATLMVYWARNFRVQRAWGAGVAAWNGVFYSADAFDEYYGCVTEAKTLEKIRRNGG